MNKKPLIAGNWKMELSHKAAEEVGRTIKSLLSNTQVNSDIVICPSYTSLAITAETFAKSSKVNIGAQNISTEEKGAYTGQVSVTQIKPFVTWCVIGHSEVRAATGVTDEGVVAQLELLQKHDILPIICIGETAQEREAGQTIEKITNQMNVLLTNINRASLTKIVIAYEPIWAIGTGITPEPDEASEIILLIRKIVANKLDKEAADRLRILYGGSVKPDNAAQYVGAPLADGVLVGGASTHPGDFVKIIKEVEKSYQ